MASLVAGASLAFTAFSAGLIYAVAQGAGIIAAMNQISIATGLTGSALLQVRNYLLALGGSSIFSIQQLAAGIALLGQYSFKTVSAIESLATAGSKLAEATGSTPVQAFKLLAVTMQAFKIPADQAQQVADLLFYSYEHGTPSVTGLTSALGQLGGAADILHIPLSQLIPALDVVTIGVGNMGTAALGLRFFLTSVTGSSKAARDAFQQLGISAFDAKGNFVGLPTLLGEISDHLKGLSTGDQFKVMQELFPNIRSSTAIKQLITQLGEYTSRLKDTSNAQQLHLNLENAVALIMSQVGSVLKETGSNFQDFAGLVGIQVIPILLGFLQKALYPLSVTLRLLASNPAIAQLIANFLMFGTALSGIVVVGAIVTAIFTSWVGPALLVAGAFAALAALAALIVTDWNDVVAVFNRVKPVLAGVALALLGIGGVIGGIAIAPFLIDMATLATLATGVGAVMLTEAIPGIAAWIASTTVAAAKTVVWAVANASTLIPSLLSQGAALAVTTARTALAAALNFAVMIPSILAQAAAWVVNAAAMALSMAPYILLIALITGAAIGLGLLIAKLGGLKVILDIAKAAWAAILPAIQQAGTAIKGAFMQALEALQPLWTQLVAAFNQAKPILIALGGVLGGVIVVAIGVLIGVIRMLISIFANVVVTVIQVVAHVVQVFTGLVQFFTGVFKIIFGIFTLNGNMIKQGWDTLWKGVLNIIQGTAGAIWAVFTGFFRTVLGGIQNFINGIVQFFQHLFSMLVGHSIVPDMLNAIVSAFAGLPGRVIGAIGALAGMLWNAISGAWNHAMSAVNDGINKAINAVKQVPGKVVSALGDLGSTLWNAGVNLIGGFIGGIKSMFGNVISAAGNLLGSIRNMFPHSPVKEGPLQGYENWMPTMIRTMASTAEEAGPSLRSSMAKVAGGIQQGITSSSVNGVGGAGTTQFIITLDGKVLFDSMQTRMRNALQVQGMSRKLL